MKLIQWWFEGYKLRGEACKQGGIVGSVMLAVLAATVKASGIDLWVTAAALALVLGIGCSAMAYWVFGQAITNLAENKRPARQNQEIGGQAEPREETTAEPTLELNDILETKHIAVKMRDRIWWAERFGLAEVLCLLIGFGLGFYALSHNIGELQRLSDDVKKLSKEVESLKSGQATKQPAGSNG